MVEALVELVVAGTGLWILQPFGRKDHPGELEAMLAGLALWILVGLAILGLLRAF